MADRSYLVDSDVLINLCKSNVIIDQEFINPKNEKYLFFLQRFLVID